MNFTKSKIEENSTNLKMNKKLIKPNKIKLPNTVDAIMMFKL